MGLQLTGSLWLLCYFYGDRSGRCCCGGYDEQQTYQSATSLPVLRKRDAEKPSQDIYYYCILLLWL